MDIPTLGLDASEGKSEGYERARATYSKIINRLHIFKIIYILNQ
jgi:hypothetical protein